MNLSIPGVGIVQFPDTMDESAVMQAAKSIHDRAHGMGPGTPNFTGQPMFPNLIAPYDRAGMGSGLASDRPADTDPSSLAAAAAGQPNAPAPARSDWRDTALDLGVGAAATGGGALGAAGGPAGAIAGAGLAGAEVSMLADMARAKLGTPRAPGSAAEFAGNTAMNAGASAGLQGAGEIMDFFRMPAARTMARGAFPKNMPEAYVKDFGGVMPRPWENLLSDPAFPAVGRSGQAEANMLESSAKAKALEAANPTTYSPEDVLARLDGEIARMERISSTPAADVAELKNLRAQWIQGNVPELPPPPTLYDQFGGIANPPVEAPPREIAGADLAETKRFAGRIAKAAYRSPDTGSALRASAPNTALYNKALAAEIRARLGEDVPGLAAQDAKTQYWKAGTAALRAAEKASPRPVSTSPVGLLTGIGGAAGSSIAHGSPAAGLAPLAGLAAYDLARSPTALSAGAKALATPTAETAIRLTPQVAGQAAGAILKRSPRHKASLAERIAKSQR